MKIYWTAWIILSFFALPLPLRAEPPTGSLLTEFMKGKPLPAPAFKMEHPGDPQPINLARFGRFRNVGTNEFYYEMKDTEGLRNATPEGVHPNQSAVLKNGLYQKMKIAGLLKKNYWKALQSGDWTTAFFIWANAREPAGIRTYYTAVTLEKSGHILPAIQAYQAVLAFFPKTVAYGPDKSFVWYPAEASLWNIKRLLRDHPELGWDYEGGDFSVRNGGDSRVNDDIFAVTPGKFIKKDPAKTIQFGKIVRQRGSGKVRLVQYKNKHWQMLVDGNPFMINGLSYSPTRIGLGPKSDPGFSYRWMSDDRNQNGKSDTAYDAWVDANRNDVQDPNEPAVGDFQLMKDMGVNAIRLYHIPTKDNRYNPGSLNKEVLRDLYSRFGIRVIVGDFLGAYTLGSGADWETGTDYTDLVQRSRMKQIVYDMVTDLKDEPFVLLWILGNENNMPSGNKGVNATRTNAANHPKAYASFLNEVAQMIHKINPHHPVAVGNLEVGLLEAYSRFAPALDILALNSYRGDSGFGSLWKTAQSAFDRPVFILEYGCDAYHEGMGVHEDNQVMYLDGALRDIVLNQAGGPGIGTSIGGVVFEYLDEWWKDTHSNDPEDAHQIKPSGFFPFPDGHNHEEWFGIVGQGNGRHSPFQRQLRKAYDYFKKKWVRPAAPMC